MNWVKENLKLFLSLFGTVTAVIGFVIAQYIGITMFTKDVQELKTETQELKSSIKVLDERMYQIQLFVMNQKSKNKLKTMAKGIE